MLVRTGVECRWGRISVAVPVAYLAMLCSDWLAGDKGNRHKLPLITRHAAMDMSAIGWGNDSIHFKLSQKSIVAGLNCGQ